MERKKKMEAGRRERKRKDLKYIKFIIKSPEKGT